jgi:hypothetical protein
MTDEELINGLRQNAIWVTTHEAADRIEALTAHLAKAVEALRDVHVFGVITHTALAALAELEGKNA